MDSQQFSNFSTNDGRSRNLSNFFNRTLSVFVPEPPKYLVVVASLLYIIIFILGVFGNVVVIVVILANKNMKSTVNLFLINLCVADLLVMIICMPPTLVELHMKEVWYLGEFMCKYTYMIIYFAFIFRHQLYIILFQYTPKYINENVIDADKS